MRLTKHQSLLMALTVIGLFFVIGFLFLQTNKTLVTTNHSTANSPTPTLPSGTPQPQPTVVSAATAGTTVNLQQFHRTEMKKGKKVWEAVGQQAQIIPDQNLIKIESAQFTFFRPNDEVIELNADQAVLNVNGSELKAAELFRNVKIVLNNTQTLTADYARYEEEKQLISVPGKVSFDGPQFSLTGSGLTVHTDTQELALDKNVHSLVKPREKAK